MNKWIRENFTSSRTSLASTDSRRTESGLFQPGCASDGHSMADSVSDAIPSIDDDSRSLGTVDSRFRSRVAQRVQAAIQRAEDEGTRQEADTNIDSVYVMDAIQFAQEAKKDSAYMSKQSSCKENVPLAKSEMSMWSNFSDSNASESIMGRVYEA